MNLHSLTVGSGPSPVVFLHGLFGQGKNWGSIANALGTEATSHLIDLPNHGLSPWTETFELDQQADLIADWIADAVGRTALVGHSLGGKLAMRVALRRPELVDRLMVVDISPARNEAAQSFAALVAALRQLDIDHLTSRTQADRELTPAIPDDVVRRFLLQNLRHKDPTGAGCRTSTCWATRCTRSAAGRPSTPSTTARPSGSRAGAPPMSPRSMRSRCGSCSPGCCR
nr:alpha/beta fold hydrolase [Tessaracoccus defluvii]